MELENILFFFFENFLNWIGIKEDCEEIQEQPSTEMIVTDQVTEERQS